MQKDRFPLVSKEVEDPVILLRRSACLHCPIVLVLSPDVDGPRAPLCGMTESKDLALARGNGQPLDGKNPNGAGYGNWCRKDPAWCPLKRWAPEFLARFAPKIPTEEEKAAKRLDTVQNIGRALAATIVVLKQVPDTEASNLLVAAVGAGMPLDIARTLAAERGLPLGSNS